jgi:glycosyltransferase involved in cell wall biosynthesis
MRTLHIYAGNLYGGIETLLVTLARYREHGSPMDPHFALCFPGRLHDELSATGVPVYDLGPARVRHPWTVWNARSRLAALLRQHQFGAVVCHACWPHALFGPVVRRQGIPLLFWAHDAPTGRHWVERLARLTSPDRILANSRYTAAAVPKLFPGVPCEVLCYPVPPPPPLDRAKVRREVRAELATASDAVVIVMACRLERWKGHSLLIDALSVLADMPGWVCWIAGGAQRPHERVYRSELESQVRQHGLEDRVRFLGQRSDVPRLLAAADLHCQPNTGPEPFGIAFIEALYAGLPVVTTALGGANEIVEESCGITLASTEAQPLAFWLSKLIADDQLRQQLGFQGPHRATKICDPAARIRDLQTQISTLTANLARPPRVA